MRNSDPFSDLIRSIEENLQREGGDCVPPNDDAPGNGGGNGNSRRKGDD